MKDIVDVLQDQTNKLTEEMYKDDKCKPIFQVFNIWNFDGEKQTEKQTLVITIKHLGSQVGRVIFPREDGFYAYESLRDIMQGLYNQTM